MWSPAICNWWRLPNDFTRVCWIFHVQKLAISNCWSSSCYSNLRPGVARLRCLWFMHMLNVESLTSAELPVRNENKSFQKKVTQRMEQHEGWRNYPEIWIRWPAASQLGIGVMLSLFVEIISSWLVAETHFFSKINYFFLGCIGGSWYCSVTRGNNTPPHSIILIHIHAYSNFVI